MANVNAPFGFLRIGTSSGVPNYAQDANPPWRIAYNAGAIYYGDLVRLTSASDTGYIIQATAADSTIPNVGVFYGCSYFSTSQKKTIFNNYWPGTDVASGNDVTAYVETDPNALFMVQAGASAVGYTALGQTVDIVVGTGSTTTGQSGMYLGVPTTTATLPFKVVNLLTSPPGINGRDYTTAYNIVIVAFNYQIFKSLTGQP